MMKVLGDRVLVLLPPIQVTQEDETGYSYQGELRPSGIILAKPADAYREDVATRGIVVQLGEKLGDVLLEDAMSAVADCGADGADMTALEALGRLAPAPFEVEVGDCVLFPPSVGEQLDIDCLSYKILRESDLIGILQPTGKEAEWLCHLAQTITQQQERISA